MNTLKASVLSILMLTLVLSLLSITNASGMTGKPEADLVGSNGLGSFPSEPAFSTKEVAGRQVEDLVISVDGAGLTLTWSAVPGALSYKVYSALSPDLGFSEDFSGSFAGNSWTTPVNDPRRFYYVTSVGSGSPAGFVFIPSGTFMMGDTIDDGVGYAPELPVHSVTLSSFYLGQHEVTQAEFATVMGYNPSSAYGVGDSYPVYYVNWYSAIKYCNLRSMLDGLTPVYSISSSTDPADWGDVPYWTSPVWDAALCNWNANGDRLPTEAEWEYAARGATNDPDYLYSGSDVIDAVAWYNGNNSPNGSKPVGTKASNGIGTYDMSGNVSEWCWDWYNSYSSDPQSDPTGPLTGSWRTVRGGYWNHYANTCRIANRLYGDPSYPSITVGFRVCRTGL